MICQSINIPDDISTIIDWKPHKIEKKLIEINSEFSILFTGYFNGNLRNAVGHGDFFYDESSKKMHFNHIWKWQEKFKIELSFNEFYQIFSEVFACRDIFMETVFLVRLFDYRTLLTKIDQRK